MNNDALKLIHTFGHQLAEALNAQRVPHPDPDSQELNEVYAALLVVIGIGKDTPIGGAINYDSASGTWKFDLELQMARHLSEEVV